MVIHAAARMDRMEKLIVSLMAEPEMEELGEVHISSFRVTLPDDDSRDECEHVWMVPADVRLGDTVRCRSCPSTLIYAAGNVGDLKEKAAPESG